MVAVITSGDPKLTSASQVTASSSNPGVLITGDTLTQLPNGTKQIALQGIINPAIYEAGAAALPLTIHVQGEPTLSAQLGVISSVSSYSVNGVPVTAKAGQPVQNVQVATLTGPDTAVYSGMVSWGDGDTSPAIFTPLGGDSYSVTASKPHVYAAPGSYTVTVTVNGPGDVPAPPAVTTATVSAGPAPVVNSITPASGSTSGGTAVTITGTNLAAATTVKFGTIAGRIVSNSGTQIVAIAPAGSAGVVNVVVATASGTSAVSTADHFTYVGAASLTHSTVTLASASIAAGASTTVTLTARDASGNQEPTGGLNVAFSLGSGSGKGQFGPVIDNGNGTYTATFTGSSAGPNTIGATINGRTVTSAAPAIRVAPVVTASAYTFTESPFANVSQTYIITMK